MSKNENKCLFLATRLSVYIINTFMTYKEWDKYWSIVNKIEFALLLTLGHPDVNKSRKYVAFWAKNQVKVAANALFSYQIVNNTPLLSLILVRL